MTLTTRIAFTSCIRRKNDQDKQPQWQAILDTDPDYLFLMGDHIYMDFGYWPFSREYTGKPRRYNAEQFEQVMRSKYQLQWREPHFRQLITHMRNKNGLFAVWDDHDFAWNNACGKDVPDTIKHISRHLFHEFLDCSPNKPQLYGYVDMPLAKAIFLDNRFYADKRDHRNPNASMLGDDQWQFLTECLHNTSQYTLIISSLSLTQGGEDWRRYPHDWQRLQQLISGRRDILFIGGDIHRNAFLPPGAERPCYEIIASGMAVNQLGLPFGITDQRNWGLLELSSNAVDVYLHRRKWLHRHTMQRSHYRINAATWQAERLSS